MGVAFTSEERRHAKAELTRWPREAQAGIERRHVVLVREIRAEERRDDLAVFPGELRVQDIALGHAIAARLVLEQRGPLLRHMAEVDARREFVVAALAEDILEPEVEGEFGRVG